MSKRLLNLSVKVALFTTKEGWKTFCSYKTQTVSSCRFGNMCYYYTNLLRATITSPRHCSEWLFKFRRFISPIKTSQHGLRRQSFAQKRKPLGRNELSSFWTARNHTNRGTAFIVARVPSHHNTKDRHLLNLSSNDMPNGNSNND